MHIKTSIILLCFLSSFTINLTAQPNSKSEAPVPDNIKPDVNCFTDPPQLVWGIKLVWSSNKNEVLLTDQSRICIIDGSKSPITLMTALYFGETTIMQYPIIADVDADGSAEIVAVGLKSGAGEDSTLNIFKSSTTPWAPARKVWNQYIYNAVNVNEDLTIPEKQYNSAIRFPGKDGELGTADDIWPFNNIFQQQTVLNKYVGYNGSNQQGIYHQADRRNCILPG